MLVLFSCLSCRSLCVDFIQLFGRLAYLYAFPEVDDSLELLLFVSNYLFSVGDLFLESIHKQLPPMTLGFDDVCVVTKREKEFIE